VSVTPSASVWRWWALWKVVQGALTAVVFALFLGSAVLLLLALTTIAEGRYAQVILAFSGCVLGLLLTWLFSQGARQVKRRVNDLAIAGYTATLPPTDAATHFREGFTCTKKGDYARAIAHYDAALRLDPEFAEAHLARVFAYTALDQLDQVIVEYTAALNIDPTNVLAYCARAAAYNGLSQFDRSLMDAAEVVRLAPHLHLGYAARGYGFLLRGHATRHVPDYLQAVAEFTEALRINPNAPDCLQGRAWAYRSLGETDLAAADEALVQEARERGLITW
jgi:tetratricopeptide (TPR) repeat protein